MKNLIIILAAALAIGVSGCASKSGSCSGDSCCATPAKKK
jgi:outer membrane lipoprotein SlyB